MNLAIYLNKLSKLFEHIHGGNRIMIFHSCFVVVSILFNYVIGLLVTAAAASINGGGFTVDYRVIPMRLSKISLQSPSKYPPIKSKSIQSSKYPKALNRNTIGRHLWHC